ncbi:pyridoxamine 5'-phosphate oxidase family protein [Streptomyces sp. NPDC057638]|uniref:pyridoxamine 5'-phosphate oxidase family protein n=1 Tax=Streptomyces sp. NPDC057638 TaxID=3346190 RepID=UPI0036CC5DBA
MALSVEEREQFLAEPHIAALAVDSGESPDRAPLNIPIWYGYTPGGDAWIVTGVDSRKAKLIASAGRFSLMVDRAEPTVRYVTVEGPVVSTEIATKEQMREVSARYVAPERLEEYLTTFDQNYGEQLLIRMRPERWLSADMGAV